MSKTILKSPFADPNTLRAVKLMETKVMNNAHDSDTLQKLVTIYSVSLAATHGIL